MQSQTIPKETFIMVIFGGTIRGYDSGVWFGGMIRGMIRGYDSQNSNILPLLKSAHVKKRHSHIVY